jgi:hypothetical protein
MKKFIFVKGQKEIVLQLLRLAESKYANGTVSPTTLRRALYRARINEHSLKVCCGSKIIEFSVAEKALEVMDRHDNVFVDVNTLDVDLLFRYINLFSHLNRFELYSVDCACFDTESLFYNYGFFTRGFVLARTALDDPKQFSSIRCHIIN